MNILLQGIQAIWSPYTGIVDWGLVTKYYADDFTSAGGKLFLKHGLEKIELTQNSDYPVAISTSGSEVSFQQLSLYEDQF